MRESTPQPTGPVVTLGEAMMVFNGPPEAPIDVGGALRATFAGAESNVAIGLARLGHPVRWLSAVGDDAFGRTIVRRMRGEGVDVSRVAVSPGSPTGVMFKGRRPGAEPEVMYYRHGSAFSALPLDAFDDSAWKDAHVVYLTGITPALGAGCRALVERAAREAKAAGAQVWFDPNYRRKLWDEPAAREAMLALLPHVDVLLTGVGEGRLLTGSSDPSGIARQLLARGPGAVVVKDGPRGALQVSRDGAETFGASMKVERIIDPIGAGDAFAAGFLSAQLDGLPPAESLRRGNALGAIVCLTRGDWEGLPTRPELEAFLARDAESAR